MTNDRPEGEETTSVVSTLAALAVGEHLSRLHRFSGPTIDLEAIRATVNGLRSTLGKAAERARKRTGHEFKIENIDSRTADMSLVAGIIVTRIS